MKHLSNLLHGEEAAVRRERQVGKKKKNRASEKVIRLSNHFEAMESARQLRLV